VADDEHVERGLAGQQLAEIGERLRAFRLDHRLVGVDIDAVKRIMPRLAEAHGRGVDHLVLDGADFRDHELRVAVVIVRADEHRGIGSGRHRSP